MICRSHVVFAGGAALLALGIGFPRFLPVPADFGRQLAEARTARESLSSNDDATLERLRRETASKQSTAWSEERWRSWAGSLGPNWRVRSGDAPGTCIVEREDDQVGDWAPFSEAIKNWSRLPGMTVQAVEISATGPAGGRRFTHRSASLRVQLASGTDAPLPQTNTNPP